MAIADKLKEIATLHTEEMLNKPEELAKGLTAHVVDLLPEADVITFEHAIATLAGIFYTCETVSGKIEICFKESVTICTFLVMTYGSLI